MNIFVSVKTATGSRIKKNVKTKTVWLFDGTGIFMMMILVLMIASTTVTATTTNIQKCTTGDCSTTAKNKTASSATTTTANNNNNVVAGNNNNNKVINNNKNDNNGPDYTDSTSIDSSSSLKRVGWLKKTFTLISNGKTILILTVTVLAATIIFYFMMSTNNDNNNVLSSKSATHSKHVLKNGMVCTGHSDGLIGKGINYIEQSIPYKDNPAERISKLLEQTKELCRYQYENVQTLDCIFQRGYSISSNDKALGRVNTQTKEITWLTYDEVLKRQKNFANGLLELGLKPREGRLGIFSLNCPEYVISEYGCYRHSIVVVPIYDTFGSHAASYIANQAEISVIACDTAARIEGILKQAQDFQKFLKHLILFDGNSKMIPELKKKATDNGFTLHTIQEVENLGAANPPEKDHTPKVDDLAVICYTSGTTSMPKGVMLTHENIVASIASISIHLMDQHANNDDVMISILPLAHMFQRIGEAAVFIVGGKVVYYSGDIRQLAAEILIVRPTVMLAVPRLLNRIHDAIFNKVRGSFFKRALLNFAYRSKLGDLSQHRIRHDTFWDRLVFNKVRANMGGRVRLICVGSAPLSPEVLTFLRVAIGCVISEGYGQTECVGPCNATLMGDETTGHVGPPLVGAIVKLTDVKEMGYLASENKGEILVKGPVVFKGYYKLPEMTAETIDEDGWLHTGDIGMWNPEGTLVLIDRKKNIFKLSQGEYIAPEKIENVLINSPYVQQIYVYGDGLRSMLVAIVVPEMEQLQARHERQFPNIKNFAESQLNQPAIKEIILEDFKRLGKQADLKSFELPKNIYLRLKPFSIEEGLLTPTLKSKRNVMKERFQVQIQALYKELDDNFAKSRTALVNNR